MYLLPPFKLLRSKQLKHQISCQMIFNISGMPKLELEKSILGLRYVKNILHLASKNFAKI